MKQRGLLRNRNGLAWSLVALAGIFVVALFLRVYRLDQVPPGIHPDEIINGEIVQIARSEGARIFYAVAGGREGLYHIALAASMSLPLPIHWQMRLPSILFSLVGLLITFIWVRRAFGSWAAITAAGGLAVTFWSVGLGRAALRATTVLPIAGAIIWLLLSLIDEDRAPVDAGDHPRGLSGKWRSWARAGALAILIGLSVYTYRSARMIPLIVAIFVIYLLVRHRPLPKHLLLAFGGSLIIALPLAIFLLNNPSAEPRIAEVDRPWRELLAGDPGPALKGAVATLGMFGWQGDPENHYNLADRPVFGPVGAVLFYAGLLIALWRWRQPAYALILIWLLVGLLPGMITEPVPHFIHTVVAMPVAFVFPGLVVAAAADRMGRGAGHFELAALAILLAVWIAANAYWTFNDYFTVWPQQGQVINFNMNAEANLARYLEESPQALPVAVCTQFLNEQHPFWRSGRQSMPYLLGRTDISLRWYNCNSSLVWPAGGQRSYYAFLHQASPADWAPKPWLDALNRAEVMILTAPDGAESVRIIELDGSDALAELLANLQLPDDRAEPVNLGNSLELLGYRLDQGEVAPGDSFDVDVYWRVLAPLPPDLAVFAHLLSDPSTLLAQGDELAVMTHTVLPGDIFLQRHTIPIPADAPAGSYPLSVGVYARDGQSPPLQVMVDGQPQGERVELQSISIR